MSGHKILVRIPSKCVFGSKQWTQILSQVSLWGPRFPVYCLKNEFVEFIIAIYKFIHRFSCLVCVWFPRCYEACLSSSGIQVRYAPPRPASIHHIFLSLIFNLLCIVSILAKRYCLRQMRQLRTCCTRLGTWVQFPECKMETKNRLWEVVFWPPHHTLKDTDSCSHIHISHTQHNNSNDNNR